MTGIKHFDDLKSFLENFPPYQVVKISAEIAKRIELELPKLELFCIECEKNRTFQDSRTYYNNEDKERFLFKSTQSKLGEVVAKGIERYDETSEYGTYYWEDTDIIIDDGEILIQYVCTHCQKKYYYLVEFSFYKIRKLCQYPSFFFLNQKNIEKYKDLSEKYHKEYKQSLLAKSNKLWVASFVYLRRILEDLVESKFERLENKPEKTSFIDKYKLIDENESLTPEGLEPIRNSIYSVLSKGIHTYTEEECRDLYIPVSCVIELILDKQLSEKVRNEKVAECRAIIQKKHRQSK